MEQLKKRLHQFLPLNIKIRRGRKPKTQICQNYSTVEMDEENQIQTANNSKLLETLQNLFVRKCPATTQKNAPKSHELKQKTKNQFNLSNSMVHKNELLLQIILKDVLASNAGNAGIIIQTLKQIKQTGGQQLKKFQNINLNKSEQEEWMLFLHHRLLGNKWADMTKNIQGRTDNTIKNHWNSGMRRKIPELMERLQKIKQSTIDYGLDILENVKDELEKDLLKQLVTKNGNEDELNQIVKSRKGRKPAIMNQNNNQIVFRNVTNAQINKKQEKFEEKIESNYKRINQKNLSNSALKELAEQKLQERQQKKQFQVNLKNSAFSPYHSNKKMNFTYSPEFPAMSELQRTAQKLFTQLISPLTHSKNTNMLQMMEDDDKNDDDQQKQLRENNFIMNQKSTANLYERPLFSFDSPSKMLNLVTPKEKNRLQNRQKENILIKSPFNVQKRLLFQCEQADNFFAQEN